jgi:CheY-like chemotaxis protein
MILVVEDEAISRYSFAQILRLHGHEVIEAADGIKPLKLLDEYAFDLVITELAMPGEDGFALVTRLREKWPKLPIVLLSGYTVRYGADAFDRLTEFLSKPIDPSALIAAVERLLPKSN